MFTVIFNFNGAHVPRSKARVGMKAIATLKYRPAAQQLRYLAHTVPNVVRYRNL
jgi:hypothetical protein